MGYMIKICPGLAHHLTILRQIVVGNRAAGCRNCFAVSDSCQIVGVADDMAALGGYYNLSNGATKGLEMLFG